MEVRFFLDFFFFLVCRSANKEREKIKLTRMKNCIPKKTKGKFPGRNKRETNVIRSMRTELSVVSQTQLYENADRIQKGFRMLVIISSFFFLLLLFYLASFLGVYLDLDFVLQKLNSMLLAKGIRFLFSRLGWFGLLVEGLLVLGDNSGGWCNMMAPSGGSGATWKEDTREIDILLESSWETEDTGSSVNQPVAPPVPPANPVASPGEEAGPSNPVRPFPYHDDDLIGGDSVDGVPLTARLREFCLEFFNLTGEFSQEPFVL